MLLPRFVESLVVLSQLITGASVAFGQNYPTKPIRMLASEAGGGGDFVARLVAQNLSANLGQQIVVENQGGASGAIAAQTVTRATPDGYTLLFYASNIWILPLLRENLPYDPIRDFSPITQPTSSPNILLLHPTVGANSVKELIEFSKAKPGQLNYGSGGSGSSNHLAAELFKSMAGVNIVRISYKGAGPALNALIAGQVQLMFSTTGGVIPHVKSGRLKALAITSAQPSALLPDLPTVAATGLLGYESESIYGMFAPARTPVAVVNKLNVETLRVLSSQDIREKLLNSGVEPVGNSPEQFASKIKSEMIKWSKVIKDAGIREE